jgi:hypothetical protein
MKYKLQITYAIKRLENGLLIDYDKFSGYGYDSMEEAQQEILKKQGFDCVILTVVSVVPDWEQNLAGPK